MKKEHGYVGAVNLIVDKEGGILLMKRSEKCKTYPDYWGLVGGIIDFGETPEEAARREAKEEIGVDVEVGKFIGRFYNTKTPHYELVVSLAHYSKIIAGTPHPAQPEECSEVKWFSPEEVRKMELAYDHKKILEDEGLI